MSEAAAIIERLGLLPHPEGGYYREVYRAAIDVDHPAIAKHQNPRRCAGSLIYYLLEIGDFSAFHRVRNSDEIWHFYAGGPIELHTISDAGNYGSRLIHNSLSNAEPVFIVPAGAWQAARIAGDSAWALCGCTVSPGFDVADFEMPPRAELRRRFPQHKRIIDELTRPA